MCCLVSNNLMSYPKVKDLYQELCKLNCYFTLDFFSSGCEFLGDALLYYQEECVLCQKQRKNRLWFLEDRISKALAAAKVEFKPFLLGPCKCCACQVGPWPRNVKHQFSHIHFLPCGFLGCSQREHTSLCSDTGPNKGLNMQIQA